MKKALITGVTGQDGSYLSELLLSKGYEVHGVKRRTSQLITTRVDHLNEEPNFHLHYGDVTDASSMLHIVKKVKPDEIYHLAAQSHVGVSFSQPYYTAMADALGTLHLLEAIRLLGLEHYTKFYQAGTSELFGNTFRENDYNGLTENSPMNPQSPYACAKLYAHNLVKIYRDSYDMFAVNGILFNHESPRRGENFVTRKITLGLARIVHGLQDNLVLGNIHTERDWGHARDYVRAMWMMMQQELPQDLIIATGKRMSVKAFVNAAAKEMKIRLEWKVVDLTGSCVAHSVDINPSNPEVPIITTDKYYTRPLEVFVLQGDASQAKKYIGWAPEISVDMLIREMVVHDYTQAQRESKLKRGR